MLMFQEKKALIGSRLLLVFVRVDFGNWLSRVQSFEISQFHPASSASRGGRLILHGILQGLVCALYTVQLETLSSRSERSPMAS